MATLTDTIAEGLGVGSPAAYMYVACPSLTDIIRTPDFVLGVRGFPISLTETIGVEPVVAILFKSIAEITEGIGIAEVLAQRMTYGEIIAESLRTSDAIARAYPELLTEGIGLADVLLPAIGMNVVEGLGLAEALTGNAIYGLTIEQSMRIVDALARFLFADVTEGLGLQPALTGNRLYTQSLSETLGIEAAIAPQFLLSATCDESIRIEAADVLQMIFSGAVTEGLRITGAYVSPGGNFTTWACNVATGAVTEYTNYEFNSFAYLEGKYLGASSEGLYELSGEDDAGDAIIADLKSGLIQFAGSRFIGFKAAYLGVRSNTTDEPSQFYLKIETGDGKSYTYNVLAENLRTSKVNVGKGIRTRYWSFELTSVGQDFDLESIEFVPMVAQRRV